MTVDERQKVVDTRPSPSVASVAAMTRIAQRRLRRFLPPTPVVAAPDLTRQLGRPVFYKLENLQPTGSFKVRGAFNKILSLRPAVRRRGIVAASTGNHGAAVAYALARLGLRGEVFVPHGASAVKVAAIRRLGAAVRTAGTDSGQTETIARAYALRHGMTYVSPYNDAEVIAGQGTIGWELARQIPRFGAVVVSLGGGGLASGIGAALRAAGRDVSIIAASPRRSHTMIASLAAGRIVTTRHGPTLSDATAGGLEEDAITLPLCRRLLRRCVTVGERDIRAALRFFIETQHMLCEGAAAVALAGARRVARDLPSRAAVVIVICGANIDAAALKAAL
jgi:threonine dehydratase